ncbi:hypothetical protein GDO81_016559 [Engystomops pustulosus]|uniref:Uncharacterized protein n=1 Tax=Engystomops pustulosus TaxID=76066 RepID=A0AAV7AZ73_ENGPU|nr:hypothetical protein GDO81_016559 [Engystomops pustulosus]
MICCWFLGICYYCISGGDVRVNVPQQLDKVCIVMAPAPGADLGETHGGNTSPAVTRAGAMREYSHLVVDAKTQI